MDQIPDPDNNDHTTEVDHLTEGNHTTNGLKEAVDIDAEEKSYDSDLTILVQLG